VYCVTCSQTVVFMNESVTEAALAQGVFVGQFAHSLDPKKRLTIPSEWRAQVAGPPALYVLPSVDRKYLIVFTAAEMARRIERLKALSVADGQAHGFARSMASRSALVSWDSQGRIRVNDELLGMARITDKAVLVGAFHFFEVWSSDGFEAFSKGEEGSGTDLSAAARYVGF
jgi:MraZ protein